MANREIKHTIRLAGEKEYSAALRDAQRNLKTMRSELKAETAELGTNATAQQKNEARARSLKAQIVEQEKVVETLKKALAEAKRDYSDNEDVVQKWEQKLNEARATLADMQSGLSDAESAMRGASDATAEGVVATKSFADALESVASVGESVSSAIEGIFTGLIATVRDVAVDLWELIGETAAKANNWTDIAGYWGTDAVTIEQWSNAIEASGNSFEDFQVAVSRLNLGGKGKDIAEMLGISDVNYTNQWDYAVACMEQISRMTREGSLPDNFWETVFGERKATKIMDIINDWEDVQQELVEFDADRGGFGMDSDALEVMNDVSVQINEIETKWNALRDQFAAGLGVITADLLVNVSGSLDALNEFMNADTEEAREAALEKLRQNIEEFFQKVAEAIEAGMQTVNEVGRLLKESDDPIVSAIGNAMVALTDALEWLVNNQDAVVHALEAIFGVWLLAKLAVIAGKLAAIVAQIETIKAFNNWNAPTAPNENGTPQAAGIPQATGTGTAGVNYMLDSSMASALFVTEELFNHRIKREDIDEIERSAEEIRGTMLPSPEQLAKMGYDTGEAYQNPFTISLAPIDDAGSIIKQTIGAIEDKIDQLLGGGANQTQALTSDDVSAFKGLPGLIRQALLNKISGLEVYMDGVKVGHIVAPTVSRDIALNAAQ